MAPIPEEHNESIEIPCSEQNQQEQQLDMERVVISGMSGLFPNCNNVQALSDVLYNKINPVTDEESRWKYTYPEIPKHRGKITDISRFDAQFFKVNFLLANFMDPVSRMLLEQAYQAIYDAGVNPSSLWGKKVGVYIGSCFFMETEQASLFGDGKLANTAWSLLGSTKTMFANRISYWLNTKGPSMSVDSSCCSSILALQKAYDAINSGECDAAIVGGSAISLYPESFVHYGRLMPLCMDGKTKSYDKGANGFAKSESVSVLFLQRAKNAKRIYADLCHVQTQFCPMSNEFGQVHGHYRDQEKNTSFLKGFYEATGVKPNEVEYIEGFGSGVPEVDKCELEAFGNVLCKDRKIPLLVGSVTSNIGYTEGASGNCSVIKVLLGYHTGRLAANLHCENPRDDVEALKEGRMRIVTAHQNFNRSYAGVNSISITGHNAHLLLNGYKKLKVSSKYRTSIPYLVTVSGRQEETVHKLMDILKKGTVDPEQIGLLHSIHEQNISGHLARGYIILETTENKETNTLNQGADYYDDTTRPLWFVYSGMGSQWMGMGTQLMRIPVFAASIERCRIALKSKGIDVVDIITSSEKSIFDNILHSFLGITAIQIALTDVLRELGVIPDNVIGHSVGELGCAYADGCLTAEETILSAYSRGLVSLQTQFIHGSMAAVGLGYKQIVDMCPPEIDVACHNSAESSTISGPSDVMREFVAKLTAQGIFAREVPCSNIAYHSRYIREAGPTLLKFLKEVVKTPKQRSDRWLSTSVPQERWDEPGAKLSSPEYYTNNLLNPVLFEETSKLIPSNAVLVEVAPHGLLQAILKRSMPDSCKYIPLTRRGHSDNAVFMLEAIGKMYMHGFQPRVKELYPTIEYPVSSGTPFLSNLVEWAHEDEWNVPTRSKQEVKSARAAKFVISLHDDEHAFLNGNVHGGKTLYPFSGALVCVWDTLAMSVGVTRRDLSVQFLDVHLHEQPCLHQDKLMRLNVQLQQGNGFFEVKNENTIIASGFILAEGTHSSGKGGELKLNDSKQNLLTSEEVYKVFYSRGSQYTGEFKSIQSVNGELTQAHIFWTGNWVTLLDSMLQLNALRRDCNGIMQPQFIGRIHIDVNKNNIIRKQSDKNDYVLNILHQNSRTSCGGVEMKNLKFIDLPPLSFSPLVLKQLETTNLQSDIQEITSRGSLYVKSGMSEYIGIENNVTLRSSNVGELETLHWEEGPEPEQNAIKVTVHFVGLNARDAKRAAKTAPHKIGDEPDFGYGMDYSGVTDTGERVMGVICGGAASSRVAAEPNLLWPVPAHWSLEDAATIPLPYAHAFYCLGIKSQMQPRASLLVHGATGALGLAVISIALAQDCKVFATVSDLKKKRFLNKLFPNLPDDHIAYSRNESFCEMVLHKTTGVGCDFVLNCLEGRLKDESMKCLADFGIAIDTHQITNNENYNFGMFHLTRARTYMPVDFSSIFKAYNQEEMKELQLMMSKGIRCGYVRPLPRVTFDEPENAGRAIQMLVSSRHRGRTLLCLHKKSLPATLRLTIPPKGSHLIIGATSNDILLCKMIDLLLERGARNIVLHYQEKSTNGYIDVQAKKWQKFGAQIRLSDINLDNTKHVESVINECTSLGPVEGVYVLTCGMVDNSQNQKHLISVINNLDIITRKCCLNMKTFAVFNEESYIGQDICINRVEDSLTSTMLSLPKVKKYNGENGLSYEVAIDAMERAVRASYPVLQALVLPQAYKSKLLERVATIADVNIQALISTSHTLKNVGLNIEMSKAISRYLMEQFNTKLSCEETQNLTIERICEIERLFSEDMDTNTGLNALYNQFDHDDVFLATHDTILMPTATHCFAEPDEVLDKNETYMMLVPGFEGQHNKFYSLCECLKLPAVVLQPGLDYPHETVVEMAARLAKVVFKKLMPKKRFYLLGYSYGVLVALEMAAIFEEQGLEGIVYCVDASPDTFPAAMNSWLNEAGATDETKLQDAIVKHMCAQIAGVVPENLQLELNEGQDWPHKVEAGVRLLRGHVKHSSQYMRALIETARARIEQARQYDVQRLRAHPLRSLLVVLRSNYQPTHVEPDLGLQHYSLRTPVVYNLSRDHASVLEDLRCANIVNKHLDRDILDKFDMRNICEKYLIT